MQVKLKKRIGALITLEVKGNGSSSFTADQIQARLTALEGQGEETKSEREYLTHLLGKMRPTN